MIAFPLGFGPPFGSSVVACGLTQAVGCVSGDVVGAPIGYAQKRRSKARNVGETSRAEPKSGTTSLAVAAYQLTGLTRAFVTCTRICMQRNAFDGVNLCKWHSICGAYQTEDERHGQDAFMYETTKQYMYTCIVYVCSAYVSIGKHADVCFCLRIWSL